MAGYASNNNTLGGCGQQLSQLAMKFLALFSAGVRHDVQQAASTS